MRRLFVIFWKLLSEAMKDVAKVPGWVPLAAICFGLVHLIPSDSTVLGVPFGEWVHKHAEIVALLATAVLWVLGDTFDDATFDDLTKFWPDFLVRSRRCVKNKLKLEAQLYSVSLKLAVAAKKYEGTCIQWKNEIAKCARSLMVLAVPSFFAVLVWSIWRPDKAAVLALIALTIATPALFHLYFWLKVYHMRDLYKVAGELVTDPKCSPLDLENDVRMFFWNGAFVSSGPKQQEPRPP
jgi:hypothetical protein